MCIILFKIIRLNNYSLIPKTYLDVGQQRQEKCSQYLFNKSSSRCPVKKGSIRGDTTSRCLNRGSEILEKRELPQLHNRTRRLKFLSKFWLWCKYCSYRLAYVARKWLDSSWWLHLISSLGSYVLKRLRERKKWLRCYWFLPEDCS